MCDSAVCRARIFNGASDKRPRKQVDVVVDVPDDLHASTEPRANTRGNWPSPREPKCAAIQLQRSLGRTPEEMRGQARRSRGPTCFNEALGREPRETPLQSVTWPRDIVALQRGPVCEPRETDAVSDISDLPPLASTRPRARAQGNHRGGRDHQRHLRGASTRPRVWAQGNADGDEVPLTPCT